MAKHIYKQNFRSNGSVAFEPDLGQRTYADIASRLSIPAAHLLWIISRDFLSRKKKISREEIAASISRAGHDWSRREIAGYLRELQAADCLR